MTKKIKKLLITLLAVCAMVSLATFAVACSNSDDDSKRIIITEQAFRDAVILNQEFDVMSVVENPNQDYTYSVTELYYLDSVFEIHNVECSGTKFTLTAPYNLYVTLAAYKNEKFVAEAEFILEYEITTNAVTDKFLLSWNDMGVSKSINATDEYKYGDATHSVKAKFISSATGKPCIGKIESEEGLSVTDWKNAVLKVDVYNPQEEDFIIAFQRQTDSGSALISNYITLKSKAFTNVVFSLHRFGITTNILKLGKDIAIRVGEAVNKTGDRNFTLYLSNLDIVDYSAEKFPDLEWRTDEEIAQAEYDAVKNLPGEEIDKSLISHYIADGTKDVEYMAGTGKVSYCNYADSNLSAPTGLTSLSYLKYDITNAKAIESGNYHGYAIAFNNVVQNVSTQRPITQGVKDNLRVENWENAYMGFWVYNDSDYTLKMYAQYGLNFDTSSGNETEAAKKAWTYVEWKIKDFGYTTNPFDSTSYFLRVGFGYKETGITTANSLNATFYIDGFDIYNKAGEIPDSQKTSNQLLKEHVIENCSMQHSYAATTLTATVKNYDATVTAPSGVASTTYVQYDLTNTGTSGNYFSFPIHFNNSASVKRPIEDVWLERLSDIDWTNAYMGMWVKNTAGHPLLLVATTSSVWVDGYESKFARTVTGDEWIYVEFALKDIGITSNPFTEASYNINVMASYLKTGVTTAGGFTASFYIDGFSFYNRTTAKTINESLAEHFITHTNKKYDNVSTGASSDYFAYGTGTATVKNFAGSTIQKLVTVTDTNYVDYAISKAKDAGSYAGHMIDFGNIRYYNYDQSNRRVANSMSKDLTSNLNLGNITDWSKAKIKMWIKNDTGYDLKICVYNGYSFDLNACKAGQDAGDGEWMQIELDIGSLGITAENFGGENLLVIGFCLLNAGNSALETPVHFYMTGFELVQGA